MVKSHYKLTEIVDAATGPPLAITSVENQVHASADALAKHIQVGDEFGFPRSFGIVLHHQPQPAFRRRSDQQAERTVGESHFNRADTCAENVSSYPEDNIQSDVVPFDSWEAVTTPGQPDGPPDGLRACLPEPGLDHMELDDLSSGYGYFGHAVSINPVVLFTYI